MKEVCANCKHLVKRFWETLISGKTCGWRCKLYLTSKAEERGTTNKLTGKSIGKAARRRGTDIYCYCEHVHSIGSAGAKEIADFMQKLGRKSKARGARARRRKK